MKKSVDYINERAGLGIRLGLKNIDRLLEELGSPHLGQKYIHIAGTNGKGSVSAFIAQALIEGAYKVGRFSSPKLYRLSDMYSVNNSHIDEARLEALAERLEKAGLKLTEEGINLTEFELQTALALLYFREEGCDYSLIEVGLGGIEDATNIITPVVSVITSISLDHQALLGNSLIEIAEKKAGIIKEGVPVCSAHQADEVGALLESRAKERNSDYHALKREQVEILALSIDKTEFRFMNRRYEITQLGTYQVQNAALALLVLEVLRAQGLVLSDEVIGRALKHTQWPCRFEIASSSPLIVLDGAHNEAGIKELKKSLELYFGSKELRAVFAVMRDKSVEAMLRDISPLFEGFKLPDIKKQRALVNKEIASLLVDLGYQGEIETYSSLSELVEDVRAENSCAVYVAFGSLYYLEELRAALNKS